MNTVQRTTFFNVPFWLIALVLLACALYVLLATNQTSSQQRSPSPEQLKHKVLTQPAVIEKGQTKQLVPPEWDGKQTPESKLLRKPAQLEKYKPNEP